MEVGPFKIDSNQNFLEREKSWNKLATLIFVDQPVNTGFSFNTLFCNILYKIYFKCNNPNYQRNVNQSTVVFVEFLTKFFSDSK